MKTLKLVLALAVCALLVGTAGAAAPDSLKQGTADLKSAGPMCFGPNGVLFVGDPMGAAVFAFDTGDTKTASGHIKAEGIDGKIASLLGTTTQQMLIADMAVNPTSGNVYFSVSRGRGPDAVPVICRLERSGKLEEFSLKDVKFAKATLPNAPASAQGQRGNPRTETITDLAYLRRG